MAEETYLPETGIDHWDGVEYGNVEEADANTGRMSRATTVVDGHDNLSVIDGHGSDSDDTVVDTVSQHPHRPLRRPVQVHDSRNAVTVAEGDVEEARQYWKNALEAMGYDFSGDWEANRAINATCQRIIHAIRSIKNPLGAPLAIEYSIDIDESNAFRLRASLRQWDRRAPDWLWTRRILWDLDKDEAGPVIFGHSVADAGAVSAELDDDEVNAYGSGREVDVSQMMGAYDVDTMWS